MRELEALHFLNPQFNSLVPSAPESKSPPDSKEIRQQFHTILIMARLVRSQGNLSQTFHRQDHPALSLGTRTAKARWLSTFGASLRTNKVPSRLSRPFLVDRIAMGVLGALGGSTAMFGFILARRASRREELGLSETRAPETRFLLGKLRKPEDRSRRLSGPRLERNHRGLPMHFAVY
jgi:hypothetical protein